MTAEQERTAALDAAPLAFVERVHDLSHALEESGVQIRRQEEQDLRPEPPSEPSVQERIDELRAENEDLRRREAQLEKRLAALQHANVRADREKARYEDLFRSLPDASIVTDRAGVIRAINPAAAKLLAAEPRRLRGRAIAGLVDPAATAQLRELVEQLDPEAANEVELPVLRVRGAPFTGAWRCMPLERGTKLLFVVRPVTPAPRAAHAEHEGIDVARALRDRDDLLARERALRSQLEKTDHAKDRFIAVLSHDLRGPINSVLGWTQLLRREVLSKDARDRALETIERSTRTQLGLVEELLDLSRITADKMALELVPLDLGVCARRIVDSFAPMAIDADVKLSLDVVPGPSTIFADRKRVSQVLSNLLSNALKFTPPGGQVDVCVRADGAYAVLEVQDTGDGIKQELKAELFECYRQGAAQATARAGLGLGLYIVRQLVQLHGGTVEAESAGEGRGSTFTVRLPLREMVPSVASERSLPEESGPDLAGVRVLIVEDEADARDLLTTVLAGKGASVSAASDAVQALAMFESCTPDVIVSDIEMPGEDGLSLIRRLRTKSGDVPAIAVSGFAAQKDAARALDAGFDVHVPKPIEPTELVTAIRDLARRS